MMRFAKIVAALVLGLLLLVVVTAISFRLAAAWRETAEASALAPETGRLVATRSGKVFVQEDGPRDGVPVVLFHGTAAWSELWRETMTALAAAGFRAVALDLPPFGFSDRPGDYTRAAQAERVRDVLDGLGIGTAIIVGHSFGAGAAVETVLRYPDRVRGLVLVDAALGLDAAPGKPSPPSFLRPAPIRETLVALSVTNPLATRALLAAFISRKERALPEYVKVLQRPLALRNTTADLGVWLLYFMSSDDDALSARRASYAQIKTRTTVLWGELDTVTPPAQGRDVADLISGATLSILPGVGHIPQIEDPAAFQRALVAQLSAIK